MADEPEFTVVAAALDGISGSILVGVLESAGIPAEVRGGRSDWQSPPAWGGFGAVTILAPRDLVADAKEILAALEDKPSGGKPGVDKGHQNAPDAGHESEAEDENDGSDVELPDEREPFADNEKWAEGDEEAESGLEAEEISVPLSGDAVEPDGGDEVELAGGGPPAYGSDLRPNHGGDFGPGDDGAGS